jgi:two-component system cell cycle sensor histidine kinase/response regulator CckA
VVADMQGLLRRTIGERVKLRTSSARDLPPIKANRGQIERVLLNLAANARDAMPDGGTLVVSTANVDPPRGAAADGAGRMMGLRVTDTGCGMEEEVAARAFDPFFTTKPAERGTGLGLATVYGIVKQSGGEIELRSKPRHGTTVEIRLPVSDERIAPPRARPGAGRKMRRRTRSASSRSTIGVRSTSL